MTTARVGFVVDDQVPSWQRRPWQMLCGAPSHSSVGTMRHRWIADWVRRNPSTGLTYEVFKPWRRYAAVVFLKSMGSAACALAQRLRAAGTRIVFDANVDYLTPPWGTFYYRGMAPTEEQRGQAQAITALADGIIADSPHLAAAWGRAHPAVRWIPDHVRMGDVPALHAWQPSGKLTLVWSGEAVKLFEFLAIEEPLRRIARHVRLRFVTNSLAALDRWHDGLADRFRALLAVVEHEFIPFRSIPQLLAIYAQGGIAVSPRFLDNSYNLGHTEWKVALPMACGRTVLATPVPSYEEVARLSGGRGLRLCADDAAWDAAFAAALGSGIDFAAEGAAARRTIEEHYSTPVVAAAHADWIRVVIANAAR